MREQFLSTAAHIRDFRDSVIHKDFVHELQFRIKMRRNELEDPELEGNGREYDLLRGGIRAYREMESIFEDIMNNILEPFCCSLDFISIS